MGDYFHGQIQIGGPIPAHLWPAFLQVCADQLGAAFDSDQVALDEVLYLEDAEASGGRFESLESWLEEHHIAFDRQSNAYSEYAAEEVRYRPGMATPHIVMLAGERPSINQDELEELMAAHTTPDELKGALVRFFGDDIPALEPLYLEPASDEATASPREAGDEAEA